MSKKSLSELRVQHDPAAAIHKLTKDLKRAQSAELTATVIREAIGTLRSETERARIPEWMAKPLKGDQSPGVPTLMLSDFHWGERVAAKQINNVNSFSLEIARARLRHTIETAIYLLKILDGKMRYPGIVAPLLGDMISGDIHEELSSTNELPTMAVVLDLFTHLCAALKMLADTFGHVFVPCVGGNHGRNTKRIQMKDRNHTSFDWLLYQFLAAHFADDKRIKFYIPDGHRGHYKVYDYAFAIEHGDRLGRGGDGIIGALGPILRGVTKKGARDAQIDLSFQTLLIGHWHQLMHLRRVVVNGALKGYDEYAFIEGFPFELPQQALFVNHWQHEITYRMPVVCEPQPRVKQPINWVSAFGGVT